MGGWRSSFTGTPVQVDIRDFLLSEKKVKADDYEELTARMFNETCFSRISQFIRSFEMKQRECMPMNGCIAELITTSLN